MKDIKEFATYVAQHLFDVEPELAETLNVEVHEVVKNNGKVLTGIIVRERSCNIAPTIYVNDAYEEYQNGTDVNVLIAELFDIYKKSRVQEDLDLDFFTDFEQAKKRLSMKLVNAEKNEKSLEGMPYCLFGDLAVIFQVQADMDKFGSATITVRNEHMRMWDAETGELFDYAKRNMEENQPIRIKSMFEILKDMFSDMPEEVFESDVPMYVLSNESMVNAASGMLFTDKLKEFADLKKANLFILPSSIHEVILIPDNGTVEEERLKHMVCEVNCTQVAPEEVLSDEVYYYDRYENVLMFADTREKIEVIVH